MCHEVTWRCSLDRFAETSPRVYFVEVTLQVKLCTVLAMWQKLTPDWLVSLSAMTGSSATVYCKVSQFGDSGGRNCHH